MERCDINRIIDTALGLYFCVPYRLAGLGPKRWEFFKKQSHVENGHVASTYLLVSMMVVPLGQAVLVKAMKISYRVVPVEQ